jgi:hypothetical protein
MHHARLYSIAGRDLEGGGTLCASAAPRLQYSSTRRFDHPSLVDWLARDRSRAASQLKTSPLRALSYTCICWCACFHSQNLVLKEIS